MTENQFIGELESALKQLPDEERNDIIQDIRGYFTNGREDGKTDQRDCKFTWVSENYC